MAICLYVQTSRSTSQFSINESTGSTNLGTKIRQSVAMWNIGKIWPGIAKNIHAKNVIFSYFIISNTNIIFFLKFYINSCFKWFLYWLGFVSDLAKLLDIKEIKSQPYHPQSQGKVERSHSNWKRKLECDIVRNDGKK